MSPQCHPERSEGTGQADVGQGSEKVGQGRQSVMTEPQGQRWKPPRCPLKDSQGLVIGNGMLEFCLAVRRSRFKACSTIHCQL